MKDRENNLDALRVIACLMVITIHVSADYINKYLALPNMSFTIANIFESLSRTSVPIFIMLSGGFILSDKKNKDIWNFYRKFLKKIFIPTLVWSFFYVGYSYIKGIGESYFAKHEEFNYFLPLKNWYLGGPYYHMWYLYMIVGLYLLAPLLFKIKEEIGEKYFFRIGALLCVIGIFIDSYVSLLWLTQSLGYLGYFVLGHSLKVFYSKKVDSKVLGIVFLFFSAGIFCATELSARYNLLEQKLYFYNYLTPTVIPAAITLYLLFLNLKKEISFNFSTLSGLSFDIYLVHAFVLDIFSIITVNILKINLSPLLGIPLGTALVFYFSYLIAKRL